tara:strand:- start:154 stop:540 length:387 start_codon:yes stop_codon:yes gene_type:complete
MELRKLGQNKNKLIDKYDSFGFYISGKKFNGPSLVFYNYAEIIDLEKESLISINNIKPLLSANPSIDILIIGHKKGIDYNIPDELENTLKSKKIKVEKMITNSACRTYNLLVSENRLVACILFPEDQT